MLRHYSHIGTGNYNPKTSRIYEDLGLFTADDQVGNDLTRLFNELSGYAIEKKFKRLLVAPLHLRKGLLKRIDDRAPRTRATGKPSRHPHQGQLDGRRGRSSTRSTGRARPACRSTSGCAASARCKPGRRGPEREHPGAQHPRPLPRALAHLLVRERRRPAGLHRQRRHDAPQPRPPRRGAGAGRRARRTSTSSTDLFDLAMGDTHQLVVARTRRRLDAAQSSDDDGKPLVDLQDRTMAQIVQRRRRARAVR